MRLAATLVLIVLIGTYGVIGDWSTTDQTSIVNSMNNERSIASPSPKSVTSLKWNSDLATNALNLATACGTPYMSANGASGAYSETVMNFDSDPTVDMLINALTTAKNRYIYDDNLCGDGDDCIAYTNLLWAPSTDVGCAKFDCGGGSGRWRTVCNYNPPGSFAGKLPYDAVDHTSNSVLNTNPDYKGYQKFDSNKLAVQPTFTKRSRAIVTSRDFDYRRNGIVPVPVDSKDCSASYAFTAAAIAQTRVAMKKAVRPTVSVQQIIDCSNTTTRCFGGNLNDALLYIRDNGIMREADYPYTGASSNFDCKYDDTKLIMKGGYAIFSESGKDNILNKARNNGPVGVSMLANPDFQDYRSGIFRCSSPVGPQATNHSVLLVGYNDAQNYYIIRNNWGVLWGENGFARITADPNFDCGISANRAGSIDINDLGDD